MSKKKAEFSDSDCGRRPHQNADDRLPVRNMTDWGCTDDRIKEPRYADRAYELCSQAGNEEYLKISGQVHNIRTPTMLAKQRLHKDDFQTQDRIKAEGETSVRNGSSDRPRPFFGGRKKQR